MHENYHNSVDNNRSQSTVLSYVLLLMKRQMSVHAILRPKFRKLRYDFLCSMAQDKFLDRANY